jgi:succinyl-diaminopimelate desuccinylase
MTDVVELCKELINKASITPEDAGCQDLMTRHLKNLGFKIERLRFGNVDNFWARYGSGKPLFCFVGHTDVVPPGPLDAWKSDPFVATERDGFVFGRGAADMKGSLAAMLVAVELFLAKTSKPKGSIAFLITSDEEGEARDGTARVVDWLKQEKQVIDWCLVGEPSSSVKLGDVIKVGRRGSLNGTLRVQGKQGHIAYPHLADNPIHRASHAIAELCAAKWDQGNDDFPPTSFQISNIHAGTGANNVIPGELKVQFNFRFSTETDSDTLIKEVETLLDRRELDYTLDWQVSGQPFLTKKGALLDIVSSAITEVTGRIAKFSTAGGTSDGRFIATGRVQVVELGPLNRTIHKANECISMDDLDDLSRIYLTILEKLLT